MHEIVAGEVLATFTKLQGKKETINQEKSHFSKLLSQLFPPLSLVDTEVGVVADNLVSSEGYKVNLQDVQSFF